MSAPLLEVDAITKHFGGFTALAGVSLSVQSGERIGLIGPNGSGKTTLINCISGALQNDAGSVRFKGRDLNGLPAHRRTRLGICRTYQIPKPFGTMTLAGNLAVPLEYVVHQGVAFNVNVDPQALAILEEFGLAPKARIAAENLSQVELRKLELARAVAAKPDLLICDEAMAGLAAAEVDEVLDILFRINARGITVLMIEHIMRAIMKFSMRVVCLDAGQIIAAGAPRDIVQDPNVRRAYLGA